MAITSNFNGILSRGASGTLPIVDGNEVSGGLLIVETFEELTDKISSENCIKYAALLKEGTLGFVLSQKRFYQLRRKNENDPSVKSWEPLAALTGSTLNISDVELAAKVYGLEYEITKLRNSFLYGINSYTNLDTRLSTMGSDYPDIETQEPLWCIDENGLTIQSEGTIEMDSTCTFTNVDESNLDNLYSIDESGKYVIIKPNNGVIWTLDETNEESELINSTDAKVLFYIASTTCDINIKLKSIEETPEEYTFNIKDYVGEQNPESGMWHFVVIISRKQTITTKNDVGLDVQVERGTNYLWIAASDYINGNNIFEGYINGSSLSDAEIEIDKKYLPTQITINAGENEAKIKKFNCYTKYETFSGGVIPNRPDDEDYKYKVSHLTIRGIDSFAKIKANNEDIQTINDIAYQFEKYELFWVDDTEQLYIKKKDGSLKLIGSASEETTTTLTPSEVTTYTVKFSSNNSIVKTLSVNNGNKISEPTDITNDPLTLEGWYTENTFTNKFNFNTSITKNITLYAKWVNNSDEPSETVYAYYNYITTKEGLPNEDFPDWDIDGNDENVNTTLFNNAYKITTLNETISFELKNTYGMWIAILPGYLIVNPLNDNAADLLGNIESNLNRWTINIGNFDNGEQETSLVEFDTTYIVKYNNLEAELDYIGIIIEK